jgi:hypothetical protein
MKRHMSDSLLFSISAELRHALERSQPDELMNNPFMKAYREYLESYSRLKDVRMTPLIEKNLQGIYPEGKRARITKGSPQEYQISNKAVRKALEETGTSLQDFSEIAENIFRKGRWATSYGGQPWGNIAEGLRMIVNAETTGDMVKAMDNAYDLQHNTATVFNKIKKYQREGGYKWLQDMLDFKYHAMTPRELVPLASSAAKRIAAPALLDIGDPAMDKSRENAVSASSEELVSGLESAIGRLKGNQENVYNDIWVKAQKGSGKDINEELFKWLRAQMPARKEELEAVGVNQDIIRYARLLLAEKMAPKMEVPQDIKEMVAQSIREQKQKAQELPKETKSQEFNLGAVPSPIAWMLPSEIKYVQDTASKSAEMGVLPENFLKSLKLNGKEMSVFLSPSQTKEFLAWYGNLLEKQEAKKTKSAPKTETPQPKLDWQDNIPHSSDTYDDYPNGDKPSGALVNVWHNGIPKKVYIVVHHGGTMITLDNQQYSVPHGSMDESVEASKKGLIDQITGKYNDIVSDLEMIEGINLSFVDPAKTKQAEKTESETSQKTLYLKPFEEIDWQSFSGAVEFQGKNDNEKQPLIGEFEVLINGAKMELMLIADTNGFQVFFDEGSDGIDFPIEFTTQKEAKEYLQQIFATGELHKMLNEYPGHDDVFSPVSEQKQTETKQAEKTPDIEDFWPKALSFMSLPEIEYVKQTIKDAIKAGKNSNGWLGELEIYGNKASITYSPDSQKELKKLFDAEAKKLQGTYILKIADAEDYFQKAITDYPNFGWKEAVDINSDWASQLVNTLFQSDSNKPEFSANNRTISIGNRTYTAYTPNKNGDILILYGDYNNSGEEMNYNWTGAAQFKTANRTKDEVLDELEEWIKGEVDYYDPQI